MSEGLVGLRTAKTKPKPADEMPVAAAPRQDGPRLDVVMAIPYDLEFQPFTIRSIRFADILARRGHKVTVFHRPLPDHKRTRQIHFDLPTTFTLHTLRGAMRLKPSVWRELQSAIRKADVIHFQKSLPVAAVPAIALARALGKPLHQDWDDYESYFWLQTLEDSIRRPQPALDKVSGAGKGLLVAGLTGAIERLIPHVADTVGGASAELRMRSVEFGAEPGNVFPARVGVDSAKFGPQLRDEALRKSLGLDGPTVLYSGSLDILPDLEFFCAAIKHVHQILPSARALVIGGGFGRPLFQSMLKEHGLLGTVFSTPGFIPFADMPRHIASCDVSALPFRDNRVNRAKSSLTLVESMASGVPVVSHDVGDVAWTLGGTGELATPNDPIDFGTRVAALLSDSERRAELGRKTRERAVAHFSWESSVDWLETAYYAAIQRHRASSGQR